MLKKRLKHCDEPWRFSGVLGCKSYRDWAALIVAYVRSHNDADAENAVCNSLAVANEDGVKTYRSGGRNDFEDHAYIGIGTITLQGCRNYDEARALLVSVFSWHAQKGFPQHQNIGKRCGGTAKSGDKYIWVWRTKQGWNAELIGPESGGK